MNDDADERLIKPPVVIENYGSLDGKSRAAIRQAAVSAHVEVFANRVDIRHALNRRDVHAERPRRPEKVRTIIRRQKPMRPRGERQFARRHVRHDLVVRGASDPFVAGQATTHPLVPSRPAEPVLHRRDFGPRWPRARYKVATVSCCASS